MIRKSSRSAKLKFIYRLLAFLIKVAFLACAILTAIGVLVYTITADFSPVIGLTLLVLLCLVMATMFVFLEDFLL